MGHQVLEAQDGVQALEICLEQGRRFDLVVMDVRMPKLSGIEVIRRLRAHAASKDTPILVISGTDTADGMKAGADHFLGKPHSRRDLEQAIHHTLIMRAKADGDASDDGTLNVT